MVAAGPPGSSGSTLTRRALGRIMPAMSSDPTPAWTRRPTRAVRVGRVTIGGGAPVVVQSMTSTHTRDAEATLAQIRRLAEAGCELVRVAVPALPDAEALPGLVAASPVPLVGDIHFSTALAVLAVEAGCAKIRLNPGNTDDPDGLKRVLALARERGTAIRFGANAGSVHAADGGHTPPGLAMAERMVEMLLGWVEAAEREGFRDLVLSAKASDAPTTLLAYRRLAAACDLPLHLGVTEAGPAEDARLRSAVVLGSLLADGIGDTVRVSVTGDPVQEVAIAEEILTELGLRPQRRLRVVSCPTCGRCEVDLAGLVARLKAATRDLRVPLTVAVMGCIVNGPGEAREADVGIAAGKGRGVLFRRGERVREVPEAGLLEALLAEIRALAAERED